MTKIPWATRVWNPVTGCTPVSRGCDNCWAHELTARFPQVHGRGFGFHEVNLHGNRLNNPLQWKKPQVIFVCAVGDLFHEQVPFEFIDLVLCVAALCPQHTFLILTKRPARAREYFSRHNLDWSCLRRADELAGCWLTSVQVEAGWREVGVWDHDGRHDVEIEYHGALPLPNVWLGVSVEDQDAADIRVPMLLDTPVAHRFISMEPMLGPIDLRHVAPVDDWHTDALDTPDPSHRISWVVLGGESGARRRPFDHAWARLVAVQCQATRTPFFFKQGSGRFPGADDLLDGRRYKEFPPGLPVGMGAGRGKEASPLQASDEPPDAPGSRGGIDRCPL